MPSLARVEDPDGGHAGGQEAPRNDPPHVLTTVPSDGPDGAPRGGPPASVVPRLEPRPGAPTRAVLRERARSLGVHPLLVRLMYTRGIEDPDAQHRFFAPTLGQLRPPDAMAGFTDALDLLEHAHRSRTRIGVFGDYDVDGVATATILATYLEALGLEVVVRVAHRDRGYGFTRADADAFAEAGAGLVVTGDTGTNDLPALERLRERGLRSIVIDHHHVPSTHPPADAFINPHQPDCAFPFKGLCSAGVAFYLCAGLRTRLHRKRLQRCPDPRDWLDLVAVATVCDMMPLVDENRVLARVGLRVLHERKRPGLRALLEQVGVAESVCVTEEHAGYKLGPRLNAPGRLGSAEPALRLLRARTLAEARLLGQQIEALNLRRRHLSDRAVAEALALLAADRRVDARAGLVVAHEGWLPGIVGIAAARVTEEHGKPAIVLAIDAARGIARGSVRSVSGVDVRLALEACAPLLERFGGHREAAGLSVASARIEALAEAFDAAVAAQQRVAANAPLEACERVDCALPLRLVDANLCGVLSALGPYGVGFEAPRFSAEGLRVEAVRVLKERHLSLVLAQDGTRREAIAFGQAHHGLAVGDRVGCIFVPGLEEFRGQVRLRLQTQRLWKS